ncbi:COMM domain-containing protein 7 isoform X1 [Xenopus laevis]|uniref:COMM domain-containing protein 7 isoform X1 n=1 Tax=Xenopus laevis TaxID=8355 RepID=A0A8J1M4P4_XENLA|nr:COMM domain-containing protein 7 isoform X1 [Xenopus laevis]
MSLRHSLGPLPDSSLADIHNLQQLTSQQVSRLCNIIFVFLKEQKEQDFQPQIDDFARDNGISLGPLKSIVKSTFLILNDALKRNVSAEQLRADLIGLGLDEEKASYFEHQWGTDLSLLSWMAAERTLLINQLVDMEWKFGVTAASSETDKSGSIFLQLKMMIRRGSVTEPVYVELTLPQFYSFLHEIERAKNSLECFS